MDQCFKIRQLGEVIFDGWMTFPAARKFMNEHGTLEAPVTGRVYNDKLRRWEDLGLMFVGNGVVVDDEVMYKMDEDGRNMWRYKEWVSSRGARMEGGPRGEARGTVNGGDAGGETASRGPGARRRLGDRVEMSKLIYEVKRGHACVDCALFYMVECECLMPAGERCPDMDSEDEEWVFGYVGEVEDEPGVGSRDVANE